MKYTEKIHAEGLLIILEEPNTCRRCPKSVMEKFFGYDDDMDDGYDICFAGNSSHILCWSFILGTYNPPEFAYCPCDMGRERAGELSWLALEAKGYI